ncbi:glycosyltransferase [Streptomyces sp. NPDC019937]|uniref:glycosyltransferase n=1 Tax=Streptomyces sp. NPDC019937 TaxID=3154787 RepID=UPI0033D3C81B
MHHISWYGAAVAALLGIKLLLSIKPRRRPRRRTAVHTPHTIHAVITVYNETPAALRRCLQSVLDQTRHPDSLTVIDDCSRDHTAQTVVDQLRPAYQAAGIRLDFIRFPVNRGKREGLAAGFAAAWEADIYLCIDSDTVLDEHAVAEAAAPFARRRVHAVTGLVLAANRRRNLLTRLIDMRYQNAFLGERVAYSRLGSVLCACGSLALYRGATVRKHLDDFLQQRFLGRPCTFGDDRRLTYYCLLEGQSLIVPTAVAWTDVPESMRHFLKQQTRWTKSFIREGVLLAFKFRVTRAYWWLNLVELATWIAFTSALLVALAVMAVNPHAWTVLAWYGVYVAGAAWLRSVHYLRGAGAVPLWDRAATFLVAPVYALMNLTLLIPLRLWALVTLRDTRWGTRQNGAEVRHDEPPTITVPKPRLDEDTLEIPRP